MNSITILGVLTKDPRRVGAGEPPGCRMRLAEAGARPGRPLYIDASIFGPQAESCLGRLREGSRVAVLGRLRFREWKRVDLSRACEHWIAAERVEFLPPPAGEPDREDGHPDAAPAAA